MFCHAIQYDYQLTDRQINREILEHKTWDAIKWNWECAH